MGVGMKRSKAARTISSSQNPSKSTELQRRMSAYALSATAAGVAVMACSVVAEAAPVCTPSSVVINPNQSFPLNPSAQQISPFQLAATFNNVSSLTSGFWNRGFLTPNVSGADALLNAKNGFPAALASGASIGPGGKFGPGRSYGLLFTYGRLGGGNKTHHNGNFDFSNDNLFGFKFAISGQTHYGWVRLAVTFVPGLDGTATAIDVLEYAYESNPNTAILAGSCTIAEAPSATGSLGALALGAEGLNLWRK